MRTPALLLAALFLSVAAFATGIITRPGSWSLSGNGTYSGFATVGDLSAKMHELNTCAGTANCTISWTALTKVSEVNYSEKYTKVINGVSYPNTLSYVFNAQACPAGSVAAADGISCNCSGTNVPTLDGKACSAPGGPGTKLCALGTLADSGYYDIGTSASGAPVFLSCKNSCVVAFDGIYPAGSALVSGVKHYYAQGEYAQTGATCDSSAGSTTPQLGSGTTNPPNNSCASGQSGGEVNGKFVCVDNSTGNVVPGSGSGAPPSGSTGGSGTVGGGTTGGTNGGGVGPGTGSTTSTTVVTGSDGSTTTTTTTMTTDGSGNTQTNTTTTTCDSTGKNCSTKGTTTGEKTDDQKTECERNPNTAGCALLGTGTSVSVGGLTKALSITRTGGWSSDQSCPADKIVHTHLAGDIPVPFTMLCTAADYARPMVLAVAWLIAIGSFMGLSSKRD
ncbi:virulence factor TspB C-terminal domain-related protein [Ideonella sp.]|uniref:virulence factor TspB C-terminal domain-related protein n=1 Tax=Ideonella sp. TaxID=1929293 RepID=UPI00351B012F